MNGKIKVAFSEIHADENLKKQSFKNIIEKTRQKRKIPTIYKLIPMGAIASLLLIFGHFYFAPVSFISIDVNPSIELSINTFDRVILATASNGDAQKILETVNLNNLHYIDALETLDTSESFNDFSGEYTEITVISENSEKIITDIEGCDFGGQNIAVHSANITLKEEAAESGLSFGKYRAYLELLEINPSIEIQDIENFSMSELRDLIESGGIVEKDSEDAQNGNGQGNSSGNGNGQGNSSGNGNGQGNSKGKNND